MIARNFRYIASLLCIISVLHAPLARASGAGDWIGWSCSQAQSACIGSAVCIPVAVFLMLYPVAIACAVILSGTSNYCAPGFTCPDSSTNTYCTPPGNPAITDSTLAHQCCVSPAYTTAANPIPSGCPQAVAEDFTGSVSGSVSGAVQDYQDARAMVSTSAMIDASPTPKATDVTFGSGESVGSMASANLVATSPSAVPTGPFSPQGAPVGNTHSGSGGGGGSLSSLGDSSTNSTPQDANGPNSQSGSSQVSSAYSGGEGGVGAGKSKAAGTGIQGDKNGGQTVEFGGSSGAGGSALIGEDPVDYFTRIGLDESIFKVLHRRYEQVSPRLLEGFSQTLK